MKFRNCGLSRTVAVVAALLCTGATAGDARIAEDAKVNPIQKVIQLLTQLEVKIRSNSEAQDKAFAEFEAWCKDSGKDKEWEIKTAKSEIEDLNARISKSESDVASTATRIEELAASISTNEADMEAASDVRKQEHSEFTKVEAELTDILDTLDRAINILERKLRGSALVQSKVDTDDMAKLTSTLSKVLEAAALSVHDRQKLLALTQSTGSSSSGGEDEMEMAAEELGAPAPEVYRSHSESIVDVLEDLRGKASAELAELQKQEMNGRHNYELKKQALTDAIASENKELGESKAAKASAQESLANSQGDLTVAKKDLADAEAAMELINGDCKTAAADHEVAMQGRAEELEALAKAKQALTENTSGAEAATYSGAMFLQLGSVMHSNPERLDPVVALLRRLAEEQHAPALTQLAGRVAAAVRYSSAAGDDPFVKVKALIQDLIDRLTKEAGEEATHKAYCDKEMGSTQGKIDDLKGTVEILSAKHDQKKADSAKLKNEVQSLQGELAELAKSQAEADSIRNQEHAAFTQTKADLEQGLMGVRQALQVLREYYANEGVAALLQQPPIPEAHDKAVGAGTSIIGMLEVIESDFGKNLASAEVAEDSAAVAYQKLTLQNKVSKATMEADVKYKTKEASTLDKEVNDLEADRSSTQSELDAVLEYSSSIRSACELTPMSYEERKARREAELDGLKRALEILEGEGVPTLGALIQQRSTGLASAKAFLKKASIHPHLPV